MVTIRARLFTGLIIITLEGFLYLTYWVATDIRIPAVRNLVENAIDFTPEQGEISIRVKRGVPYVSIIVDDTGVGIPAYATDRIFEKYYSIARPDTDKKSSGLGLNFVKEVASLHHGEVTVKNRTAEGVRAVLKPPITLPVIRKSGSTGTGETK